MAPDLLLQEEDGQEGGEDRRGEADGGGVGQGQKPQPLEDQQNAGHPQGAAPDVHHGATGRN
ncbi:hypothetical protein D3C81_2225780 [compost metagenome]